MSAEDNTAKNKETVRKFFAEVINNKRSDFVEEMFATNFVLHAPLVYEEQIEGRRDDVLRIVEKIGTAIPDIYVDVDEYLVAEDDFVVAHWMCTGRHGGRSKQATVRGRSNGLRLLASNWKLTA